MFVFLILSLFWKIIYAIKLTVIDIKIIESIRFNEFELFNKKDLTECCSWRGTSNKNELSSLHSSPVKPFIFRQIY